MPLIAVRSAMRSRVVPGVAVTMARSRSRRRLKREDLPALGGTNDGEGEACVEQAAVVEGVCEGLEGKLDCVQAGEDLGVG